MCISYKLLIYYTLALKKEKLRTVPCFKRPFLNFYLNLTQHYFNRRIIEKQMAKSLILDHT